MFQLCPGEVSFSQRVVWKSRCNVDCAPAATVCCLNAYASGQACCQMSSSIQPRHTPVALHIAQVPPVKYEAVSALYRTHVGRQSRSHTICCLYYISCWISLL